MFAIDCEACDEVRNELFRALTRGEPKRQTIARALGLTPQTLSRRLADQETTFGEVLAGLRRNLAVEYLKIPEVGIDQIALLLGYRQVGSFSHAFRRWTGHSPSAARRMKAQDAHRSGDEEALSRRSRSRVCKAAVRSLREDVEASQSTIVTGHSQVPNDTRETIRGIKLSIGVEN